jgi:Ca-activated chloride channel family protein
MKRSRHQRPGFGRFIRFTGFVAAIAALAACGGGDGGDGDPGGDVDLQTVEEGDVRLELPRSVPAGAPLDVTWEGPDESNDYIALAEEGAPGDETVDYTRTRQGSPLTVRAPDTPGSLEVRYVRAEDDSVLLRAPLEVTEVEATLEVPTQVGAGAPVEVRWEGPDNPNDYIALAEEGTPGDETVDYTRTRQGSPLTVRAPDTPGRYELRYVMSQADRVIARSPVEVTPVEAQLDVRDTLMVATPVEIRWSGPSNPNDYIAFAEIGTPGDQTVSYARTRQGSPLSLVTPERPGRYEVRYVMSQSDRVLVRDTVTVLPLQARLDAPDTVAGGREVRVSWLGPDGPADFIALASPDAGPEAYESRALSRAGDPATLYAPTGTGTYELRYVWAEEDSVLARRPLVVIQP